MSTAVIFLLVMICSLSVVPVRAQDAQFEDIFPDQPDPLTEDSSEIGIPDELTEADADSEISEEPEFEDIQSPQSLNQGNQSKENFEVEETLDLSLPEESLEAETLAEPIQPLPSAPQLKSLRTSTPPDYDKERHFNLIFRRYNERPLSVEDWGSLSSERRGESYVVQKGDTLWDISTTFFGEGQHWPKVWSLNQGITNPHRIEPQEELVFFPGSLEQEPQLEIARQEEAQTVSQKANPDSPLEPKLPRGVKIPPPVKSPTRLAGIPESLPKLKTFTLEKPDFSAPSIGSPGVKYGKQKWQALHFFAETEPQYVGEIVDVEVGGKVAAQFQHVFIRLESPQEGPLVALKISDSLTSREDSDRVLGHIFENLGELKVLDLVNPSKGIYRALVTSSPSPVEVGAKVVVGKIKLVSAAANATEKSMAARVFAGRFGSKQRIFGTGGTVFLTVGSAGGAQVGDVLPIYADPRLRKAASSVLQNFRKIGQVKIYDVSENFSSAFVVSAKEAVRVGDFSGLAGTADPSAAEPSIDFEETPGDVEATAVDEEPFEEVVEEELGEELGPEFGEELSEQSEGLSGPEDGLDESEDFEDFGDFSEPEDDSFQEDF